MNHNTNDITLPTTGRIFDIQHFCVDDGPGIRTTVFLKGCPLRCVWCHNPESHESHGEILFRPSQCSTCGACVSLCQKGAHAILPDATHLFDRSRCVFCGRCIPACPTHALEGVGKTVTVEAVLSEILTDQPFYKSSGGGVTVSGGEPTAQPRFTEALLAACKREGLHTCIETCGWCPPQVMTRLLPYTDLFLVDWKVSDDALHQRFTGVSNEPIVQNISLLCDRKADVILRCPLIPEINLNPSHYDGIAALASRYPNIRQIDLEPYHPMGVDKTTALGKEPAYSEDSFLSESASQEAKTYLQQRISIPVRISGK